MNVPPRGGGMDWVAYLGAIGVIVLLASAALKALEAWAARSSPPGPGPDPEDIEP